MERSITFQNIQNWKQQHPAFKLNLTTVSFRTAFNKIKSKKHIWRKPQYYIS